MSLVIPRVTLHAPTASTQTRVPVSEHRPGPVRRVLERVGGVLGAASKVPCAVLPCLVGGTMLGGRLGKTESRVALALDVTNAAQASIGLGVALSAGGGLSGFLHAFLTKGLIGGLTVAMVSREGSSAMLARQLAEAIDKAHPSDGGRVLGAIKGAAIGLKVAVVGGARVGYSEGRGYVCGIYEGLAAGQEVLRPSWSEIRNQPVRSVAAGAMATTLAVHTVPAGMVQGLSESMAGHHLWNSRLQFGIAAVEGGAVGLLAGYPLGFATCLGCGALGIGAGLAMARLAQPERQIKGVRDAVARITETSPRLGDSVTEKNRDFICGAFVGAAAGLRASMQS